MKRRRLTRLLLLAAITTAMVSLACPNGDLTTLALTFSGVEPLTNGYHYEGWAIIGGAAVSTGKFNVDAAGDLVTLDGDAIPGGEFQTDHNLTDATNIVISIEPDGDTDDIPASTKFLAGAVTDDAADLAVDAPQALDDDFSTASGKYILATPTDGAGTNELSGVWFLDLGTGSPEQGLMLPILPTGWKYEGWCVISGQPVTTGKFTDPDAADESAPYSGSQPGPDFPGEDFLENAPSGLTFPTDLSGSTVVISIEPDPDDNPDPFTLKPLVDGVPDPAQDHVTYDMDNQANMFPTGIAELK